MIIMQILSTNISEFSLIINTLYKFFKKTVLFLENSKKHTVYFCDKSALAPFASCAFFISLLTITHHENTK